MAQPTDEVIGNSGMTIRGGQVHFFRNHIFTLPGEGEEGCVIADRAGNRRFLVPKLCFDTRHQRRNEAVDRAPPLAGARPSRREGEVETRFFLVPKLRLGTTRNRNLKAGISAPGEGEEGCV